MGKGLIVIMDLEEAYATKLADYFALKSGIGYDVRVFTDYNSLVEYDKYNSTDILLISDIFMDSINELSHISQIFILRDYVLEKNSTGFVSIFKYQPCENIIREVMTGYAASATPLFGVLKSNNVSRIISVYSPVKRCGKSTFSIVAGCLLAKDEPTLYLCLEDYSALSYFTDTTSSGDLSDLLYYYIQNPLNLDKKLMSLTVSLQELDFVPPMHFSMDFKCMKGVDWSDFIRAIASLGRYQNIIIDISDSVLDIFEIFSISDTIYFPILDDVIAKEKISNFENMVCLLGKEDILDKIKKISLPETEYCGSGSSELLSLLHGSYAKTIYGILNL